MRTLLFALVAVGLTACSAPAAPAAPGVGSVTIRVPAEGTVYFGGLITVEGSAQGIPPDGFDLYVSVDSGDAHSLRVVPLGEQWRVVVPLARDATGTLTVEARAPSLALVYDEAVATVAEPGARPTGTYAMIVAPAAGEVAGGELIPVSGIASGVGQGMLTLHLLDERGGELQRVQVLLPQLTLLDDVPFTVDLATGGYTGRATLRLALDGETLDEVSVMLDEAAG